MGPYAAAVFDMDGTILNTLDDLQLSLNHVLQDHGMPPHTLGEVRAMVGNGIWKLMNDAVPQGTPEAEVRAVYDDFCAYYADHCNDHTHPYAGITELIAGLRNHGVSCAVVSNKGDFAVQELAELHFPGVFDAVLGQQEGLERKPHRAMVDAALERMGCPAPACYVGDSEVDVVTAANADLDAIIVTWGFRDPEFLRTHGAEHLVDTVGELESAILGGHPAH